MKTYVASLCVGLTLSACTGTGEKITFFSLLPPSDRDIVGPADLPPEEYSSEFWIDRKGCTFIRTEQGWVPQMTNKRTRLCDPDLAKSNREPIFVNVPPEGSDPMVTIDPETGITERILLPAEIPESYVQVGFYEDAANGLRVRDQFAAMGFPIVGGETLPPAGKAMAVVLGPFVDDGALGDALNVAQSLGYQDAYSFQNQ